MNNLIKYKWAHGELTSAILLTFFIFLAKAAGAVKEITIARTYGITDDLDAFNFAVNSANTLAGTLLSILTLSLAAVIRRPNQEIKELLTKLRRLLFIIGLISSISVFISLLLIRKTAAQSELFLLSLMMLPACLAAYYSSIANLRGKYASSLLEGLPSALIALVIFLFGPIWVGALAVLVATGTIAQAYFTKRISENPDQAMNHSEPGGVSPWQEFRTHVGPIVIAQLIMGISTFMDSALLMASRDGALSEFSYASRAVSIVLGITALTISRYTTPIFVRHSMDATSMRRTAKLSFALFVVGSALVAGSHPYITPAISVLYQGGSFGDREVETVASVASILAFQIPPYIAGIVFVGAFSASGRQNVILATAILALMVKLFVYYVADWTPTATTAAVSIVSVYGATYTFYLVMAIYKPVAK